jgi:hypothetical protein
MRFFRNLHRNELKFDVRFMKSIVINDNEIAVRNSKFLDELHSALSTAVMVFGKGCGPVKGKDFWKLLAKAQQKVILLSWATGLELRHKSTVITTEMLAELYQFSNI